MLVTLAEEKARQTEQQRPSTSLPATKKLVDPKAKPWDDARVWGAVLSLFGRTA